MKSIPDIGNNKCKGPGVRVYLARLGMARLVCGWRPVNEAHLAACWLVRGERVQWLTDRGLANSQPLSLPLENIHGLFSLQLWPRLQPLSKIHFPYALIL